jgi:MFS family permease
VELIVALAVFTAVAAAVRSTWSPCGVSMLSAITPLSERGRGRRFGATASWFVIGSVVGGATLGAGAAGLAAAASWASLSRTSVLVIAAACAALTAIADAGWLGVRLPRHTRQVNEDWISRYRGWACGVGFGWQIGVGLSTFIVTPAVYLMIALAALTASPLAALAVCGLFGLVRGLAILLGVRITSPQALVAFHRRFEQARLPVRRAVIASQFVVAVSAGAAATSSSAAVVAVATAVLMALAAIVVVRLVTDDTPALPRHA